ncbi:hypothetical protein KSP40_PGU001152 [Platanthera guangdongensis]|uniref:Derlin n=1 Tax=Platanthera guangdongensis TaxID=2320717 RepID=A0ABR2LKJ3_9ASPA
MMAALIWAAKPWWLRLRSILVSFVIVLLSHIALVMVPRLFHSLSLSAMLPIAGSFLSPSSRLFPCSALSPSETAGFLMYSTYALAGWLRRILGIPASAPAMVTGHVLFLWAVHITVIREAARRGLKSGDLQPVSAFNKRWMVGEDGGMPGVVPRGGGVGRNGRGD